MSESRLTAADLDAIEARANAAYPGPWHWRGNTEARHFRLQSPTNGGMTVMDFVRYGMNGAQPRFAIDGIMHKAEELVEYEVAAWSKDIYRKDVSGIGHPDAQFIAHAREDVPALLAEIHRLKEQRKFLLAQLAKRDAETGRGDKALREFLSADPELAETTTTEQPAETCGKCKRPFNPADPRWDGSARYASTPFCRRCIDACHEASDAFHRCVICDR
ncbi:hypothetical protein [Streptomyces sp. NPDC096132]|uniref:hypothetical protein n=1 Tax=Streptomyces sp. NPDC096132 TaxID=3366075 RepID=UPI00382238CC